MFEEIMPKLGMVGGIMAVVHFMVVPALAKAFSGIALLVSLLRTRLTARS